MAETIDATEEEAPRGAAVIRISRLLPFPPERVWAAFTDPSRVSDWWGPEGFSTTTSEHDLRPGGRWRFVMHGPDGTDYRNLVIYRTVEPPRLLAYSHFVDAEPEPVPHFDSRVDFAPEAGGTRVTLNLDCWGPERRDEFVAFGAVQGGRDTLARLERLIAAG